MKKETRKETRIQPEELRKISEKLQNSELQNNSNGETSSSIAFTHEDRSRLDTLTHFVMSMRDLLNVIEGCGSIEISTLLSIIEPADRLAEDFWSDIDRRFELLEV